MKLFQLTALSAILLTTASFAGVHEAYTSQKQKEGKIIRILLANHNTVTACFEPSSEIGFLSDEDLGETFTLGQNINTYKQCDDATCMNQKVIGIDQYVVSRNNKNEFSSSPSSYNVPVDDNFGKSCTFETEDDDCIGWTHCSIFKTPGAGNQMRGKWVKISIQGQSEVDCVQLSEYSPGLFLSSEAVKQYHLQGKLTFQYTQCTTKKCTQSKPLGSDEFFIKPGLDETYFSEPMAYHISLDPKYGQTCDLEDMKQTKKNSLFVFKQHHKK